MLGPFFGPIYLVAEVEGRYTTSEKKYLQSSHQHFGAGTEL